MARLLPILLLLATICGAEAHAQTRPDPGFRAWLWLHAAHPRDAALRDTLRTLGFHGLATEPGENASRLAALGIPYYVDQAVGDHVLAPSADQFERARGTKASSPLVRPRCLHDPAVIEAAGAALRSQLAKLKAHPPAFVSLRDEPSFTSRLNPIDWCESPHAQQRLETFLATRWGDLSKARQAWDIPSDRRFAPMRTQTARNRHYHTDDPHALVPWNDTRAFADQTFATAVDELSRVARDTLPGLPVGILGGQMPHAFGGFDWERLRDALRVIEVYDHGGSRDIVRSLATRDTRFLSTLVTADPLPPRALTNTAWDRFLQGDHELVVYEGKDILPAKGQSAPSPWIAALTPHLRKMAGPELAGWRRGKALAPQIAVVVSMPSIRLHWMQDSRRDGLSWVNRLTSYEFAHSTQARTREAWVALLEDLGIRFRFVTPAQVADGALKNSDYRALVLPRTIALSSRDIEAVEEFVAAGGLLIADCQPALHDGRLARRARPGLDTLLGVRRRGDAVNLDGGKILARGRNAGLPYPIAEPRLLAAGARARRQGDGIPAMLVGSPSAGQRGRTLYLNLLVLEYVQHRLTDPDRAAWLRSELESVLNHAGVRSFARLTRARGAPHWPVAARCRRDGNDVLLALHVNVDAGSVAPPWDRVLSEASIPVQLTLEGTWNVSDTLSGERLGAANRFAISVPTDRPRFLRLSR